LSFLILFAALSRRPNAATSDTLGKYFLANALLDKLEPAALFGYCILFL